MTFDPDAHGSNKGRTFAFRDDVTLFLQELGLPASRPLEPKLLGQEQRAARDRGDVCGTPWFLAARCKREMDLSGEMDRVTERAHAANNRLYATVFHRRGHHVGDSYAVMPLHTLANAILLTPPRDGDQPRYLSEHLRAAPL